MSRIFKESFSSKLEKIRTRLRQGVIDFIMNQANALRIVGEHFFWNLKGWLRNT